MNVTDQSIYWKKTQTPEYPYEASWDGKIIKVRLNDFPAEPLYTLIIDGNPVESFDEWPLAWIRITM